MSRRFRLAAASVLIVTAILTRLLFVAQYPKPVSDGIRVAYSFDSLYVGEAQTFIDKKFFGAEIAFYQFNIRRHPSRELLRTFRVVPPREDLLDFSWVGNFEWADDSLGVEIGMWGAELRIQAIDHHSE